MDICTIKWNFLSLTEWQDKFQKLQYANLLQSYEYGISSCKINQQKARWGLIYINDVEAGMVQIHEAGILYNLLHGFIIDRGPLWFDGFGSTDNIGSFMESINKQFPKRFGRKRRFIPEFEDTKEIAQIMVNNGFTANNKVGKYQTIWIDLTKNEQELKDQLKSKWRNDLKKSGSYDMKIEWDETGATLPFILEKYTEDKSEKGYNGASPRMLMEMSKYFAPNKNIVIGTIIKDKKLIASILLIIHGSSATYQIGWVSDKARKVNANNFALWQAMLYLKRRNIKYFDLGGVNDDDTSGIKKFKEGMGGKLVQLCGLYN